MTTEWKNLWREIYVEEFGEEEVQKRIDSQFVFPEPTSMGLTTYANKILSFFMNYAKEKRISHTFGVGGYGFAHVLDNKEVPETEFFSKGRAFRVRIRHGNFIRGDDASLDGRSVALKFDDVNVGGPFDVLFDTGRVSFFQNITTVMSLAKLGASADEEFLRNMMFERPINLESFIDKVRRAPESFTHLHYYAHSSHIMAFKDGTQRFIRIRLMPEDVIDKQESGLPSMEDQKRPWHFERDPDEKRPNEYLRTEFKEKLSKGLIRYFMQIQIHDADVNTAEEDICNASVPWNVQKYPWKNIVEVVLTTPMSDTETEKTEYAIVNRPIGLFFKKATSEYDFNSVAHAREIIYPILQENRRPLLKDNVEQRYTITLIQDTRAAIDHDIRAAVYGTKCRTEPMTLTKPTKESRSDGVKYTYIAHGADVGQIFAVDIFTQGTLYVSSVAVHGAETRTTVQFPCHRPIEDRETFVVKGAGPEGQRFAKELKRYLSAAY